MGKRLGKAKQPEPPPPSKDEFKAKCKAEQKAKRRAAAKAKAAHARAVAHAKTVAHQRAVAHAQALAKQAKANAARKAARHAQAVADAAAKKAKAAKKARSVRTQCDPTGTYCAADNRTPIPANPSPGAASDGTACYGSPHWVFDAATHKCIPISNPVTSPAPTPPSHTICTRDLGSFTATGWWDPATKTCLLGE